MVMQLTDSIHDLDVGRVFSIGRRANASIHCLKATVWLTEEGLAEDVVLGPGECYRVRGNGQVVISALGETARFSVSARLGFPARVMAALRGRFGRFSTPCAICANSADCTTNGLL